MKTSRRLLLGTFLALYIVPVGIVAYSRIDGGSTREEPAPSRTPTAELAQLRDYNAIEIRGDIGVEIMRAPTYSIEYIPLSERRGNLTASVADGTLTIEAYGNENETTAGMLRIGMPELIGIKAEFLNTLSVRDFDSADLELDISWISDVNLDNNRIGVLQMEVNQIDNLNLSGNTIGSSEVRTVGTTITSD